MSMHYRTGGSWKEILSAHYNSGGTWKQIYSVYQRVSGVWKLIHQYMPFQINAAPFSLSAECSITINRNGTVTVTANAAGNADPNWIVPASSTVGDDYEVRFTLNSGDASDYSAAGSWLALTSNRKFGYSGPTKSGNVTIEIRHASNTDILVSDTTDMTASTL